MLEYTTVEGHEIVRDGEYETRDGSKAIVLGFREGSVFPVVGYIVKWGIITWRQYGMTGELGELYSDLMRPYVEDGTLYEYVEDEDPGFLEVPYTGRMLKLISDYLEIQKDS